MFSHTKKKRGARVTNKEWREFWKEMESQGIVGLLAVQSNWFWWCWQFWGRSSPEKFEPGGSTRYLWECRV